MIHPRRGRKKNETSGNFNKAEVQEPRFVLAQVRNIEATEEEI
jgi:hypothetical protein